MLYRVLQTAADVLLTAFFFGLALLVIHVCVVAFTGVQPIENDASMTDAVIFISSTIHQLITLSVCIHLIIFLLFKR